MGSRLEYHDSCFYWKEVPEYYLERMSEFRSQRDRLSILMVAFMNVLVTPTRMESAMSAVKHEVFTETEENCLPNYLRVRGPGRLINAQSYVVLIRDEKDDDQSRNNEHMHHQESNIPSKERVPLL